MIRQSDVTWALVRHYSPHIDHTWVPPFQSVRLCFGRLSSREYRKSIWDRRESGYIWLLFFPLQVTCLQPENSTQSPHRAGFTFIADENDWFSQFSVPFYAEGRHQYQNIHLIEKQNFSNYYFHFQNMGYPHFKYKMDTNLSYFFFFSLEIRRVSFPLCVCIGRWILSISFYAAG